MTTQNENRDPLTGVFNWKHVSGIMEVILDHNGQVALILVDMDRMKSFNDKHGKNQGN